MSNPGPVSMLVTYRPKKGCDESLQRLIEQHGATLVRLGLLTEQPVRAFRAADKRGHGEPERYFVEMFQWRDAEASSIAHQTPEVMAIWEPMEPLLEDMTLTVLEELS